MKLAVFDATGHTKRHPNGPKRGCHQAGEHLRPGLFGSIARADVAEFMLKPLKTDSWLRKAMTISD